MTADLERSFLLADGYRDREGKNHRDGILRCATAREELRALSDFRAHLRPESFLHVMLARVMVRLGELPGVDVGIVERLSRSDLAALECLYREMNGY
jgi:hypothetical protein